MMHMDIRIRNEIESDYRAVEEVTREAFWNLYVPGCNEHYLAHVLRNHPDFIAPLDFVAVFENRVIGNIMYTKSFLADAVDSAHRLETVMFGTVSVLPEFQRRGVGSAIMQHSIRKAKEYGFNAIVIHGDPHNYCRHGFKSARDFRISDTEGRYPYGLLALVLKEGLLDGHDWRYHYSDVYNVDNNKADEFDKQFARKKKEFRYTQEVFSIGCRAYLS